MRDAGNWPDMSLARYRLMQYVARWQKHSRWLCLHVKYDMAHAESEQELFACVGFAKDYKMCILIAAEREPGPGPQPVDEDGFALRLSSEPKGRHGLIFQHMHCGAFVKQGFGMAEGGLLRKMNIHRLKVKETETPSTVFVTGQHDTFELYDCTKKLEAPAKAKQRKQPEVDQDRIANAGFQQWFLAGMSSLGGDGQGKVGGTDAPHHVADMCPENEQLIDSSSNCDSSDTDDDDRVAANLDAHVGIGKTSAIAAGQAVGPSAAAPTSPGPTEAASAEAQPSSLPPQWLPRAQASSLSHNIMEHTFLWLTRSNRQAKCHRCQAPIDAWDLRVMYDPHSTELGPSRRWKGFLWQYYHLRQACLVDLYARMCAIPPQFGAGSGSSSSSASFIEAKGWRLVEDIAMRPRSAQESTEARKASTAAALAELNRCFAALAAGLPS